MKAKGIAHLGLIYASLLFPTLSQASMVSELLITEVMVNPASLPDSRGEWFEIYNPTNEVINLFGTTLRDDGSNSHSFDSDLLVLPEQYLTLARSDMPGFIPDYVYTNFTLSNRVDEIIFSNGMLDLLRLDYGSGFGIAGQSRELMRLPMHIENYQLTPDSLVNGYAETGTPGAAGSLNTRISTVPLPATASLFLGGLICWLLSCSMTGLSGLQAKPLGKLLEHNHKAESHG